MTEQTPAAVPDISWRVALIIVCIMIAGCVCAAWAWMHLTDLPLVFDEVTYFFQTKGIYEGITGSKPFIDTVFRSWNPHGGTFQFLTALGMLFTAPTPRWMAVGNLFCIPLLILSLFTIGSLIHSRKAGIIAALYAVTTPMMAWLSHTPLEDYVLVSFVALAICFLLISDSFRNTGASLLFGVSAGLAVVAKLPALSFFYLPVAAAMMAGLWRTPRRTPVEGGAPTRMRVLLNILAAGLLALGISSLWYVPHRTATIDLLSRNQEWGRALGHPGGGLEAISAIVDGILYDQLGILHGILAIAGAAWSLTRMKRNALLWLMVLGCALFWINWPQKDPRYTVPWLAAIAPWAGAAVAAIPWRRLRQCVIGLVGTGMILLFVGVNFTLPGMPDEKVVSVAGFNCTLYVQRRSWIIAPPRRERWPYSEIVETMKRHYAPRKLDSRPYVLMTVDDRYFGPATLELYAELAGLPVFAGLLFDIRPDLSNFEEVVKKADYLLFCSDCPIPFSKAIDDKVREDIVKNPDHVRLLEMYPLPNGATASLFLMAPVPGDSQSH